MIRKLKSIIMALMILCSIALFISPTISALPYYDVDGYVYVDGVLTTPEDIIFTIDGRVIEVEVFGEPYTGYYDVNGTYTFQASAGDVGRFVVVLKSGLSYSVDETVVIDTSNPYYLVNLTIDTSTDPVNHRPNAPVNPSPANGATGLITNPTLSVEVSDIDGDNMKVTFYDGDGNQIGFDDGVTDGSIASVTWSGLSYSTIYSWYAVANDGIINSHSSSIWSFTTEPDPSDDDDDDVPIPPPGPVPGGGDITGGDDTIAPTAAATVDVNTGNPGLTCTFDASESNDPDGTIENYTWDFDDGTIQITTDPIISHTFNSVGVYNAMLTVEDNDGLTDELNEPIIIEIVTGNNPPTNLVINPDFARVNKNTGMTFTVSANDPDENASLRYYIDWGDGENMVTDHYNSSESVDVSHQWETYGVYLLSIIAEDEQNATISTSATVWVDVYVIDDEIQGWLIDTDSDDSFDRFNNSDTNQENEVQKQNESEYLIDVDNDGTWDYVFNVDTNTLNVYNAVELDDDAMNWALLILIGLILLLIIIFVYLSFKNRKEQQKREEQRKQKEKKKKQEQKKQKSSEKKKQSSTKTSKKKSK